MTRSTRSGSGVISILQLGHILRTRRCDTTPRTEPAIRYGSTPMSFRRSIAEMVSSVWIVDSTKWPVMAARIAISAVSPSRISPIQMISGSCRRQARSALAKVSPTFSLMATWATPSIWNSTGSSREIILTVSCFSSWIIVYKVEVLPEPVGPTIRITPLVFFRMRSNLALSRLVMPMPSRVR